MDKYFKNLHVSAFGVCDFSEIMRSMSQTEISKAKSYIPDPKTVIVALFPYFAGKSNGNLSLYARGTDYHHVIGTALSAVCDKLKADFPQSNFHVLCDASPLPEVRIAHRAGLGKLGDNRLIFDKSHGSFVFIGTILTDKHFPPSNSTLETCIHCKKCENACPTGSISGEKVNKTTCLSHLTQSNSDLTPCDELKIKNSPLIWGCDICSLVCPLNQGAKCTDNRDFTENLINSFEISDIEGLTRREFKEKYPNRAFTFRGTKPILRNLNIKKV